MNYDSEHQRTVGVTVRYGGGVVRVVTSPSEASVIPCVLRPSGEGKVNAVGVFCAMGLWSRHNDWRKKLSYLRRLGGLVLSVQPLKKK